MKSFIVLFALAAISLSSINAQNYCSVNDYKPVSQFPILGPWIVYKSYDNGPEIDYKCSFYEMAQNDHANIVWRSAIWYDNWKSCTKGFFTYTKPGLAVFNVIWNDFTSVPQLTIVSTDYETYWISRACLNNEGNFCLF